MSLYAHRVTVTVALVLAPSRPCKALGRNEPHVIEIRWPGRSPYFLNLDGELVDEPAWTRAYFREERPLFDRTSPLARTEPEPSEEVAALAQRVVEQHLGCG